MGHSSIRTAWRGVAEGYDRRSVLVVTAVILVGSACGIVWRDYVSLTWADFDGLLLFLWLAMMALGAHRFEARRDLPLALVAFGGGLVIETWGTRSGLWTYFTHEQPPLFILPAWPVAALATERLARAALRVVPRRDGRVVRWLRGGALLAFCMYLWVWTAPGRAHPLTWVAYAFVALACLTGKTPREDLVRFAAGSLLGWLLEYWGTSRECWTYWDGGTPPLCAVFSHGFATVAFARGAGMVRDAANVLASRWAPATAAPPR